MISSHKSRISGCYTRS